MRDAVVTPQAAGVDADRRPWQSAARPSVIDLGVAERQVLRRAELLVDDKPADRCGGTGASELDVASFVRQGERVLTDDGTDRVAPPLDTGRSALPHRLVAVHRYSAEELIEALHGSGYDPIPAGVVKLAWRELRCGAPTCFHVSRTTPSGPIWVLAVILPVDGGYLVMQIRPRAGQLAEHMGAMYAQARRQENAALAAGASRARATDAGVTSLLESLHQAGISGLAQLSARLLLAEALQRSGVPLRAGSFGPLAKMYRTATDLGDACEQVGQAIAGLPPLSEELAGAADDLGQVLAGLHTLSQATSAGAATVAAAAPVLANTSDALRKVGDSVTEALQAAHAGLVSAQRAVDRARVWTGVSQLVSGLVRCTSAQRLADYVPSGLDPALRTLVEALQASTIEMAVSLTELPQPLEDAADRVTAAGEALGVFHRWLARYRLLVTKAGLWAELGELTAELDRHLVGVTGLRELSALAARCRSVEVSFDLDPLARHLHAVREVAADADCWPSGSVPG